MDEVRNDLPALTQRLDRLRPLSARQIAALWPKFENDAVYYTYATNAIEGSTLTQSETATLLEYGVTVGAKPLRDQLDAVNGHRAFRRMLDAVRRGTLLDEATILEIHRTIAHADDSHAGSYRTAPVYIVGSTHVPPAWSADGRGGATARGRYRRGAAPGRAGGRIALRDQ